MAKSTISEAGSRSSSGNTSTSASTNSKSKRTNTEQKIRPRLANGQGTDKRKRLAANARERKRMHLLNRAYDQLRRRLADADNKSKYDVLVQAKEYIQALAKICDNFDKQHPDHPAVAASQQRDLVGASTSSDEQAESEQLDSFETSSPASQRVAELQSPRSNISHHEIESSCLSPCLSLPESLKSSNSSIQSPLPTTHRQMLGDHFSYRTANLLLRGNNQQQVPENLTCSALLNSPPITATDSLTLAPDYLPRICQLKQQVEAHQQFVARQLTSTEIYHQYLAQPFHHHIQRAT